LGLKLEMGDKAGTAIVNTADDETFFGLHVSPDLDTVTYTLAGVGDDVKGWGIAGDTFHTLEMLGRLGCETWFKLGDRDLATHIYRTMRLRDGATLTQVTAEIAYRLGVGWTILPMTDDTVRTWIETPSGIIPFQTYFVKNMAMDRILSIHYRGIEEARPTPQVVRSIKEAGAIIICPSNPIASIGPILGIPGMRDLIKNADAMVLAVSPIVGGKAVRGPAAKMLSELGVDPSPVGVAELYHDILDLIIIDNMDASYKEEIAAMGIDVVTTNTIMSTTVDKRALARRCLEAAGIKI
jgi:LPPG:FO 2-phospho-L-lactate transferase